MTGSRFRVERRSGRVAVYDTEHPEYQDTPGCLDDYPWTVCSWHGTFDETAGHWKVDQRWIDKAHAACELLNTLSANLYNRENDMSDNDKAKIKEGGK